MDFSAHNPQSTNSLNIAARNNDIERVKSLLKRRNPNCVDNRGWTCLHEAAANDSYESLLEILKHPECRKLVETYEGHTALYLACQKKCSVKTIEAILQSVDDIANYCSNEMVSPLHVASGQGRADIVQLLLDHGSEVDIQDFDGDTPLHDAANAIKLDIVKILLHAGADPCVMNLSKYTPFHLACYKGCFQTIQLMNLFIQDINHCSGQGESPLMLATYNGTIELIDFLLANNADLYLRNELNQTALEVSLNNGNEIMFKRLLTCMDIVKIDRNIILNACKPHFFNMDILIALFESDLGPEYFNFTEPFYVTLEQIGEFMPKYQSSSPLNSFLHVSEYIYNRSRELFYKMIYLFLMRGVSVNALLNDECPPIVYLHYCEKTNCLYELLAILLEHGCDIDYCSCGDMPDAIIASLATGSSSLPVLLQNSVACEPDELMKQSDLLSRIPSEIQEKLLNMVGLDSTIYFAEHISYYVLSLKHLCRKIIRSKIHNTRWKTSHESFRNIATLPLPPLLRNYLCYR